MNTTVSATRLDTSQLRYYYDSLIATVLISFYNTRY